MKRKSSKNDQFDVSVSNDEPPSKRARFVQSPKEINYNQNENKFLETLQACYPVHTVLITVNLCDLRF